QTIHPNSMRPTLHPIFGARNAPIVVISRGISRVRAYPWGRPLQSASICRISLRRAMQILPARFADNVSVLAHQHPAQERRLDARLELDPIERRVALGRLGILRAHRPGLVRIDEREVGVEAWGDVHFGVQAEAARRVLADETRDAAERQPAL